MNPDVQAAINFVKMSLGFYLGGMGAKDKNFHLDLARRLGWGAEAEKVQELFLAGRRQEAFAAVPDEMADETALLGPPQRIRERLAAWKRSPVTTLMVTARDKDTLRLFAEAVLFKRPGARVGRPVFDPFKEKLRRFERKDSRFGGLPVPKIRRFDWWYGHHDGKCAVRVDLDLFPLIHRFEGLDGRKLVTEEGGYLLHYFMYDVEDFIKKYRSYAKQPDRWLYGTMIQYRKRLWRDMVNDPSLSEDFIRSYYGRWIAFDEEEIDRMRTRSLTIGVPAVRDVFEKALR